jgi:hypothetical protein
LIPIGEPARVALSCVLYVIALVILRALPAELLDLVPAYSRRRAR